MKEWKTAIEAQPHSIGGQTLDESRPYAPLHRPRYPMLTVIDDQCVETGELIRVRKDTLSIGRCEGDLVFPGEAMMSSSHAKLSLQEVQADHWAWVLEDLNSRHGVFLKLPEFELRPGNEFVVGGTKLRLHGNTPALRVSGRPLLAYEPYLADAATISGETVFEVCTYSVTHSHAEIQLPAKGLKLGRLVSGPGLIVSDPFLEPHHATVLRNGDGTWRIADQKSLNGAWFRIKRAVMAPYSMFLVGEQRFSFKCQ